MDQFTGEIFFWLLALGLTVGYTLKLILRNEGINMRTNLIWGVIGSLFGGVMAIVMGLSGSLVFALLGSLVLLFVVNVFHQHHVEDLFGHTDREIQIRDNK